MDFFLQRIYIKKIKKKLLLFFFFFLFVLFFSGGWGGRTRVSENPKSNCNFLYCEFTFKKKIFLWGRGLE